MRLLGWALALWFGAGVYRRWKGRAAPAPGAAPSSPAGGNRQSSAPAYLVGDEPQGGYMLGGGDGFGEPSTPDYGTSFAAGGGTGRTLAPGEEWCPLDAAYCTESADGLRAITMPAGGGVRRLSLGLPVATSSPTATARPIAPPKRVQLANLGGPGSGTIGPRVR